MSCPQVDRDQVVIVQDLGPRGHGGPVTMHLTQGLTPGGILTIVASTDHEWFLDVFDASKRNKVFHIGARPHKDDLSFNSYVNGSWGAGERPPKNPIQKSVRTSVTIVYEKDGYRVFVNGMEEIFYKHRTTNIPTNRDQVVIVQDLGPRGHGGLVTMHLTQGLTPGGILTIVASTDHEWFLDVFDASKQNKVFHIGARTHKNDLVFNSYINGSWGVEERPSKNPIQKSVRTSVTIVYEKDGYRIFVNGMEEIFYKHRTTNIPTSIDLNSGTFFKVMYSNSLVIIPY